jgi:hypothetical protein
MKLIKPKDLDHIAAVLTAGLLSKAHDTFPIEAARLFYAIRAELEAGEEKPDAASDLPVKAKVRPKGGRHRIA